MVICLAGILFILIRKFPEVSSVIKNNQPIPNINNDYSDEQAKKRKSVPDKVIEKESLEPEIQPRYSKEVEKILAESRSLLDEKKEHFAEDKLIEAIRLDLHCADAYTLLGDIYFSRKRYSESKESYQASIRYDDDQGAAHYGLALILESESRLNDAANEALIATKISPKNDIWLKKLGDLYLDLRSYAKAINVYKKAAACRPDYSLYKELATKAELKLRTHKSNTRG